MRKRSTANPDISETISDYVKRKDEHAIAGDVLENLVRALQESFPDDPSAPGVNVSRFRRSGILVFYASAVRYTQKYGEGKVVLATATDESLEVTLRKCAENFLKLTPADIQDKTNAKKVQKHTADEGFRLDAERAQVDIGRRDDSD